MKKIGPALIILAVCLLAAGCKPEPQPQPSAPPPEPVKEKKPLACSGKSFRIGEVDYCAGYESLTWAEAKDRCEQSNGRLAVIDSEEESRAIHQQVGSPWGFTGNVWIGLSDARKEGKWTWDSGEKMKFGAWAPGEPNNAGEKGEDCGMWYTWNGLWNDAPCDAQFVYLCESRPRKARDFECSARHFTINDSEYCVYQNSKTYADAKKACREMSGVLASITSEEENQALYENIGTPRELWGDLWIGLTDAEQEGAWKTVDGKDPAFLNWFPWEPNNYGEAGEDCAMILLGEGKWNDANCELKAQYLCEGD